jgi:hypothetical protein
MITHLSDLLNASESKQLALSFIVIVPHWTDPPAAFLDNLKHSSFCRRVDILKAQQHYYLSGSQHAYGRGIAANFDWSCLVQCLTIFLF